MMYSVETCNHSFDILDLDFTLHLNLYNSEISLFKVVFMNKK